MYKIRAIVIICLFVIGSFLGVVNLVSEDASAGPWHIETVETGGISPSIALDSNGYPHISYSTADLKYAKWTGSAWDIETVDDTDNHLGEPSIALDSNGYPHISYVENLIWDLKYAKWTGSSWSIETVDSERHVGQSNAMALDSNGYPHICYYDGTTDDLKYAKWTGSSWSIEFVDTGGYVGWYCSIAIDGNENPHISYIDYTNFDLKYTKWTGSVWNIETVDSAGDIYFETSIALDSNGYPHISYHDNTNCNLKYAKWSGSAWNIEIVDSVGDVGRASSIALDSNGNPHISYYDDTDLNGDLKYAKWSGSAWNIETVDNTGDAGVDTTIALDNSDYPHISYRDNFYSVLRYAKEYSPGTISGTVFNDVDEDGVWDIPIEYGVWEINVALHDSARQLIGMTKTGYDGTYSFDNLLPGDYSVSIMDLGDWQPTTDNPVDVTIDPGEDEVVDFGIHWDTGQEDPSLEVSVEIDGGGEDIYMEVETDKELTFVVGNSGDVESKLRFLTFTAAIKDSDVVEFKQPYIGEYKVYLHTGELQWGGIAVGVLNTNERHGGWDSSGTEEYHMVTWKLPEEVWLEGCLGEIWSKIDCGYVELKFWIRSKSLPDTSTTLEFFPRSTEDHHPENVPLAMIMDKTNVYQDNATSLWYPAHNSFDPWDDLPPGGPGGHLWSQQRTWIVQRVPPCSYAKMTVTIHVN